MKYIFAINAVIILICGCAYVPPSNDKAQWYATIETISDKTILDINSYERMPIFGADGFGGSRRVILYFADLNGNGPVYHDPIFGQSASPELKSQHLGTITVDEKNKKVIVDLQQIVSKPGEPLKTEPSLANGTYPLKHGVDRLPPR